MGTKAREIAGPNVKETVELLNRALADEWLAYYQYWVGALIAHGPLRPDVQKELQEHAADEFKHANMLAKRIIELGGEPLNDPKEWVKKSTCGYDAPKNPSTVKLLEQNIKGEQWAIQVYNDMLKKIMISKDPVTYHIIRKILEDEIGHEQDLQDLQKDIKTSH